MASTWSPAPGGILNVAKAAIEVFPADIQQTMVAIPGSETGWQNEGGDPLSIYADGGAAERLYSCDGLTSFSVWQINLPANHAIVAVLSGVPASDPCGQKEWLMGDLRSAAKVALEIYRSQGLGAWTTYQTGAYRAHMTAAQQALAQASAALKPPAPAKVAPSPEMPTLVPGDQGTGVRVLQILLARAGTVDLVVDGVFGALTAKAVLSMKRRWALPDNPAVGAGLWLKLSGGR